MTNLRSGLVKGIDGPGAGLIGAGNPDRATLPVSGMWELLPRVLGAGLWLRPLRGRGLVVLSLLYLKCIR
jgi:hypothetical protein